MTLVTDAGLAYINSFVSIANLVLVLALVFNLRHRLSALIGRSVSKNGTHARLHAIAGSVSLVLYAILSVTSSLGPTLRAIGIDATVTMQVIALTMRFSVLIVLMAWLAATVHAWASLHRPQLAWRLDSLLRIETHGHPRKP